MISARPRLRFTASLAMIATGAIALASCGGTKGPSIALRLAGKSAGAAERCGTTTAIEGDRVNAPVTKVRVSLRVHPADGGPATFCDQLLDVPGQPPFLRIPAKNVASVDIFAEAYEPGATTDPGMVKRKANGALLGVSPTALSLSALRMYAAEDFRCAAVRLTTARAFHSASLLPDGRVLFVGGLVSSASDPSAIVLNMEGVPATGAAEIFNPLDQTTTRVVEAASPAARAFHDAQLLSGNGPCGSGQLAILLIGGLTASTPGAPIVNASNGFGTGRLVPFTPKGAIPSPLPTRAAGNEVLCLDPAANTATRMPVTGAAGAFRASGGGQNTVVAVGGFDFDPTMSNDPISTLSLDSFRRSTGAPSPSLITTARIGATLTFLDDTHALVWGGGKTTDPVGDLLGGIDGTATIAPLTVAGTAITQFHTATQIGTTSAPVVLVTGGFEVNVGGTNAQPPLATAAVRSVTVNTSNASASATLVGFGGAYTADATCADNNRYRPAGWESAIPLSRGRVLVTGGSPSTVQAPPRCDDCDPDDTQILCAIAQASVYTPKTNTLVPAAAKLMIPRFGHTSTAMPDGTVLVAGGVGSQPGASMRTKIFISDLEVYNPRAVLAPLDANGGQDLDDPLLDDLTRLNVRRSPGGLAFDPAKPNESYSSCSTF